MNKYNAYEQLRTLDGTLAKVKKKLLEPKRMQFFPLKIQYEKVLNDFFKKRNFPAYNSI